MATDLYQRTISREGEFQDLMRKVWKPTPWMIDVFVGRYEDGLEDKMVRWYRHHFGAEGSPIHDMHGDWRRGNAVIHGWCWFGFATEKQMKQFVEAWPSPAKPQ